MRVDEIVLPITKPETEWVRGRALQKMSPTRTHAALQAHLLDVLREWAGDRGDVLPEWRFRIAVPDEPRRPLVPDIAFVRHERLRCLDDDDLEVPPFAPDVAVEILSPGDRSIDVDSKVAVYLDGGGELVIIVDPKRRTLRAIDATADRAYGGGETFAHHALPGLALAVGPLFERALRRPR
jgi:Uma2 family endonuclease